MPPHCVPRPALSPVPPLTLQPSRLSTSPQVAESTHPAAPPGRQTSWPPAAQGRCLPSRSPDLGQSAGANVLLSHPLLTRLASPPPPPPRRLQITGGAEGGKGLVLGNHSLKHPRSSVPLLTSASARPSSTPASTGSQPPPRGCLHPSTHPGFVAPITNPEPLSPTQNCGTPNSFLSLAKLSTDFTPKIHVTSAPLPAGGLRPPVPTPRPVTPAQTSLRV